MDDLNTLNKKLFPYAYNILGNIDDCQDVIQDVLIKFNEKEVSSISNQKCVSDKIGHQPSHKLQKRKTTEKGNKNCVTRTNRYQSRRKQN